MAEQENDTRVYKSWENSFKPLLLFILKIATVVVTLYGLYQIFASFKKSNFIEVNMYDSYESMGYFYSYFYLVNKSSSVDSNDIFTPILVKIDSKNDIHIVNFSSTKTISKYNILDSNKVQIHFDLFQKSDSILFLVRTSSEITEYSISGRIKNIEDFSTYHHKYKKLYSNKSILFRNIIIILIFILSTDWIFVILKDGSISIINEHIMTLNEKTNIDYFKTTYLDLYRSSTYNVKLPIRSIQQSLNEILDGITYENIEFKRNELQRLNTASVFYWSRAIPFFSLFVVICIGFIIFMIYLLFNHSYILFITLVRFVFGIDL